MTTKTFRYEIRGRTVIVIDSDGRTHGEYASPHHARNAIARLEQERAPEQESAE